MNIATVQPETSSSQNDGYHFISSRHSTDGFKNMFAMQRQGKLCDIVINVGEEVLRGHKLVLASISEYFSGMFDEDTWQELNEVRIDDISPASFRSMLQFCYTGEIVLTAGNIEDMIVASKTFKIDLLEEACGVSLPELLNPSTWIRIKATAVAQHCGELHQKCHAYAMQHFDDIVETESFLQLPFCEVKELIEDNELMVASDVEVYSAVLKWAKNDLPNRGLNLSELMVYVKFPLIDKTYFMNNVIREPLMRDNLGCAQLLLEATECHYGTQWEQSPRTFPRKYIKEHIFVAGGHCYIHERENMHSECEVYNPRTNTWHSISAMQRRRSGHAVVGFRRLLYAFGGRGVATVEYYDPFKDSWTLTTSMPHKRYGHGVCSIDNSIFLCGGRNKTGEYLNNVDKFDPITGVYMTSPPMKYKKGYFNLASIDNRIYSIGGYDNGDKLKSMEIFDPREGKWSDAPSMSTPRWEDGVAVFDGYIYTPPVVIGSDWERFNIRGNIWETIPNPSDAEYHLNQVGCVYTLGSSITSIRKYDPNTNSVIKMPPMVKKRDYMSAVAMDCLDIL